MRPYTPPHVAVCWRSQFGHCQLTYVDAPTLQPEKTLLRRAHGQP